MGITVIQILLTVVAPIWILIYQKNKILNFLSPVVACYALGIIISNIPGLNLNVEVSKMAT